MSDKDLVRAILLQIDEALDKIKHRTEKIDSADYFTSSPEGMERLDGIAMLFIAIGESLKNIDKITQGRLLVDYPEIDWSGKAFVISLPIITSTSMRNRFSGSAGTISSPSR